MKYNIPSGYSKVEKGGVIVILADSYRDKLLEAGIADPDVMIKQASPVETPGGRGKVYSISPGGVKLVIRHYEHGGFFRKVLGDLFLGAWRPLKELALTRRAFSMGLPVPESIAVCMKKQLGIFTRSWFISKEIRGAVEIAVLFAGTGMEPVSEKRKLLYAVAGAIRVMHDRGLYHNDLNLGNILARKKDEGYEVFIVDLDKSVFRKELSINQRVKNLSRLNRSVDKIAGKKPLRVNFRDKLRFLKSYSDNMKKIDRELLAGIMKSVKYKTGVTVWKKYQ